MRYSSANIYFQYVLAPSLPQIPTASRGASRRQVNTNMHSPQWRWLHSEGFRNCFDTGAWNDRGCIDNCTEVCMLEGADYRSLGVSTANASVTQKLVTKIDFATNVASRLFLLESRNKYQTFRLLDNEFAFDVNLSKTGCGVNSALHFIDMDADGGVARFPTNKAGAEYGTGYCNSQCSRELRYVGGKVRWAGRTSRIQWVP